MAAKRNPMLLTLPEKTACKEAVLYTMESLTSDVSGVRSKVKAVKDQLASCQDVAFNSGVSAFLQKADKELTVVDGTMSKLDQLRVELADFFCEDAKTFRLDDCIKTFHGFFDKFNKAIQENEQQAAAAADKQRRRTTEKTQTQISCPAGATDARRVLSLRSISSCSTPPPLVTIPDIETTTHRDSATNEVGEQQPVKRMISDGDRRNRRVGVGIDSANSSSDLMEFLEAGDAALGSGEFVRAGSQRLRRRSRLALDALSDGRERATPSPTCVTAPITTDSDDLPPSLSRAGPGRWSLRERVSSRERSSPLQSASAWWSRTLASRTTQDVDSPLVRASPINRSISDNTTGTENLLDRSDYSLEQRRLARLQQRAASPVVRNSDLDDRQLKQSPSTSGRVTRWLPTVTDVLESSSSSGNGLRLDQTVDDEETSLRRWSTCNVDRAIHEVENTGKQMESVISGIGASKTRENGYQTTSDREQAVKPHQVENETRRWGRIFDNDKEDDDNFVPLQRSATLPRRWRCGNRVRPTPEVDSQMEDIPESLQQRGSETLDAARQRLDVESQSGGDVDNAQLRSWPRRTLPEIPRVVACAPSASATSERQELEQPAPMMESPPTTMDEASETSRPTSAEYDDVSTSSGSRDEGFESALDNGSLSTHSSAWSYPDFDVQPPDNEPPSTPREPVIDEKSASTTPCDMYESVSAGTSFFARSIDSLVSPELVITGDTIDIDQLDTDSSVQDSTKESITESPVKTAQPAGDFSASATNQKSSNNSKSSLLANLTARLTRPKKSTASVSPSTGSTNKLNGANGKPSTPLGVASARTGGPASGTVASAGTKSSSFTRGSLLRATMPASLRTRTKSTPLSAVSRDSLAPEPPQRTTSIRGSIHTAQRPSPATSRKPNSAPSSARKTDKQTNQPSGTLSTRSRVPAVEQTKDKTRSNVPETRGRDKLVLYKVVDKTSKSPAATTSNSNISSSSSGSGSKKAVNANIDQHRTQRLVSFNTPQQSRTFRF